jgi:hypothetical protein
MKEASFDLDNTLINYDVAASNYAVIKGVENVNSIHDLRINLRHFDPSGMRWQEAQSYIYTEGLNFAVLNENAYSTLKSLDSQGFGVSIVSHKTEFSPMDRAQVNLREKSLEWLGSSRLAEIIDLKYRVFFHSTRDSKIARISKIQPLFFIDDLHEVLIDKNFPTNTKKIWFNKVTTKETHADIIQISDLSEVLNHV